MAWPDILLLSAAGLAGGFVGGLVGVGGGVIFAPVLFFYFHSVGVTDPVLTPLTIGSSLLATLVTAGVSAQAQHGRAAVDWRVAAVTGLSSAAVVYVMTRFVTTRPWYDADVFQLVFSTVLIWVGARMFRAPGPGKDPTGKAGGGRPSFGALGAIGTAAGAVSSAVGVGGGIVLVPAYHQVLGLPMHRAVGTSSASIVFIAACGVVGYATAGGGAGAPGPSLGYVDFGSALALSIAAAVAARFGVAVAHRTDTTLLRRVFAVLALLVAIRLVLRAIG